MTTLHDPSMTAGGSVEGAGSLFGQVERRRQQGYRQADPRPARPPQEIERAKQVLNRFEWTRSEWLDYLRAGVRRVYQQRLQTDVDAYVTADDARAILENTPDVPPPSKLNRNFLGQLFRGGGWVWTGKFIKSSTEGSHGNMLKCWRLP